MFPGLDHGTYVYFRFQAKNNLAGLEPVMDVGLGIGHWGVSVAIALLAGFVLYVLQKRHASGLALAVLLLALLLVRGLEIGMARLRPPDAQNLVGADGMTGSFPARPVFLATLAWTLLVMAVLPGLPSRLSRFLVVVVAIVLVIWVILAQLYFGLYYLTDILAGIAGGGGLAMLCWHLSRGDRFPTGREAPQ